MAQKPNGKDRSMDEASNDEVMAPALRVTVVSRLYGVIGSMGPLLALLVLAGGMSLATPYFLTAGNILNVLTQTSVVTILAIGETLVFIGAGMDISIGSLLSLSAVIVAKLTITTYYGAAHGIHPVLAIFVGLIAGALFGAFNGLLITRTRVPDFIVTIAMMATFRGLALIITQQRNITGLNETILWFGKTRLFNVIPVPVVIALSVAALTWFILNYTVFGRSVFSMGGNREGARLAGINVDLVKVGTYAYMGLLCGIAGVILIGRINTATALVGQGTELTAIAASIIGGTALMGGEGTVLGAIVGSLVMGVMSNGLNLLGVNPAYQGVAIGLLLVAVCFLDQVRRRRLILLE